jgi:ATP-dependent Lon protease
MAKSKLAVLALPNPLILLPASRITFPVSQKIGEAIYTLIDESDALPVIAAVPIINNNTELSEWGTAARVLRLVKPTSRNPRQPYILSLHGLTRVHLITSTNPSDFPVPTPVPIPPQDDLVLHDVEYPPTERTPSREAVDKFKHAGIRLLDRLARDSAQQLRKESYLKIAGMLEDITNARAPGMADVLVGAISGEYSDKLGSLQHI